MDERACVCPVLVQLCSRERTEIGSKFRRFHRGEGSKPHL